MIKYSQLNTCWWMISLSSCFHLDQACCDWCFLSIGGDAGHRGVERCPARGEDGRGKVRRSLLGHLRAEYLGTQPKFWYVRLWYRWGLWGVDHHLGGSGCYYHLLACAWIPWTLCKTACHLCSCQHIQTSPQYHHPGTGKFFIIWTKSS